MFKSINLTASKMIVELIDDDFIATFNCYMAPGSFCDNYMRAIIKIYSERNLNVAANIVLYLIYMENYIASWTAREEIESLDEVPEFEKYKDDVEKYLSLI